MEKRLLEYKSRWSVAAPYLFLAPTLLIMSVLVFYPVLVSFSYSMQSMKLTAPDNTVFVGLSNYAAVLSSPDFRYSLLNTLLVVAVCVVVCLILGLALAQLLNVKSPIRSALMALAIVPWAMPPVVNGILWKFIFNSGYGLLNKLLLGIGVISEPVAWLSQRWSLLLCVSLVVAWRSIPFCAVIFLSAMSAIPERLYSAAKIDGAGPYQRFTHITLPLLAPSVAIALTNVSISAMNVFDEIVMFSGFGNLGKTLLVENYLTTFTFLDFGTGSAFSYVVMLLSGALGFFYIKQLGERR